MLRLWGGALVACLLTVSCSSAPGPETGGAPTAAQYRAAVEATRACVEKQGFEVSEIRQVEFSQELQFGVSGGDGAQAAYEKCYEEHLAEVSRAYLTPRRLAGSERADAMARLLDCLKTQGVTGLLPETTDSRVFVRQINNSGLSEEQVWQAMGCMEQHRGVWPPGDPNNP